MKIGDKARDEITSFTGIITAHCRYITGCDQFLLQPQGLDKEGKPFEGRWFDENRIAVIRASAVVLSPLENAGPLRKVGGPQLNTAPVK